MRFSAAALLLVASQVSSVLGNVLLHFPPGSNNRNRERTEYSYIPYYRLFDSSNDIKGGYSWMGDATKVGSWDGYKFYTGSVLRIQWTVLHGAGPGGNVDSQVILQYSCNQPDVGKKSLADLSANDARAKWYVDIGAPGDAPRDGYPTGPLVDSDPGTAWAGQYMKASFVSAGQSADGTYRMPCPGGLVRNGCDGDFGDTTLAANSTAMDAFFNSLTPVVSTTDAATIWTPVEFGYHETFEYYRDFCAQRSKNLGLYNADQYNGGDNSDARLTRQNQYGSRFGFECPEERDYYPWWNPSPWRDIAIFVSDKTKCNDYISKSQNRASRWYCKATDDAVTSKTLMPLNQRDCDTAGGTWTEMPAFGLPDPVCALHPITRPGEHGAGVSVDANAPASSASGPEAPYFDWTVPDSLQGLSCVIRVRYNISTDDYPKSINSAYNCPTNTYLYAQAGVLNTDNLSPVCQNIINETAQDNPRFSRPFVKVTDSTNYPTLAVNYQAENVGATFEDRSFVLKFEKNPTGAKIWNLNLRGRKGNAVQAYPAYEVGFHPKSLSVHTSDKVHIQLCGSDFNPWTDGNGWRYSTRLNMVKTRTEKYNIPAYIDANPLFGNTDLAKQLAFLGVNTSSFTCVDYQVNGTDDTSQNLITNCGKLNPAKACIDFGLVSIPAGTHSYVSTRENVFGTRTAKGVITSTVANNGLTAGAIAGIAVACIVVTGGIGAGVVFYVKKHPSSKMTQFFSKKQTGRTDATAI